MEPVTINRTIDGRTSLSMWGWISAVAVIVGGLVWMMVMPAVGAPPDLPDVPSEQPPGIGPAMMRALGWVKWSFGVVAVGAFIVAVVIGILRALGHAMGEGAKKIVVICAFVVVGASATTIMSALLGG